METNIEEARNTAPFLEDIGAAHPAYTQFALRGILHALLALHEQNETKPTTKRPTTPKEPK